MHAASKFDIITAADITCFKRLPAGTIQNRMLEQQAQMPLLETTSRRSSSRFPQNMAMHLATGTGISISVQPGII